MSLLKSPLRRSLRVLFFVQYFPPDIGAPARRAYDLSTTWAKELGWDVTVICAIPCHPRGIVAPGYRGRVFVREKIDDVEVIRVPVITYGNRGMLRRGINQASYAASSFAFSIPFAREADLIFCSIPSAFVAFSAWALSRKFRIPLILDVRDLWPESASAVGLVSPNIAYFYFGRGIRKIYRVADLRVAPTLGIVEYLKKFGETFFLPNGTDCSLWKGVPSADFRKEVLTVGYIGTMGDAHPLEVAIRAFARLGGKYRFLLVGTGSRRSKVLELVRKLGAKNISVLLPVPHERVREIMSEIDIGYVCLRDHPLFEGGMPSKTFEYLACGRPVVASARGELCSFLERNGVGICAKPESVEDLIRVLEELRKSRDRLTRMGELAKKVAERFDRRKKALELGAVIEKIVRAKKGG